jgi:hypothetical protein
MASINPNLQKLVSQARSIVPPDHHYAPISGSVVASPESAFVHIQDWAFLNGFAYVVESGSSAGRRVRYECIFHSRKSKETRNTRDIVEGDRRRVETHVRGIGCPAAITISKHKKMGDQWVLIMNDQEHNHPPAVDPFSLQPHLHRRPGRQEALRIAETHRGVVSYADSKGILKKMGLEIGKKEFYNLQRKEFACDLNDQEEARLLLEFLERIDVYVAVLDVYILDEQGNRADRVIECIAWWTKEQIRLLVDLSLIC